jgi:hypothetical protein
MYYYSGDSLTSGITVPSHFIHPRFLPSSSKVPWMLVNWDGCWIGDLAFTSSWANSSSSNQATSLILNYSYTPGLCRFPYRKWNQFCTQQALKKCMARNIKAIISKPLQISNNQFYFLRLRLPLMEIAITSPSSPHKSQKNPPPPPPPPFPSFCYSL